MTVKAIWFLTAAVLILAIGAFSTAGVFADDHKKDQDDGEGRIRGAIIDQNTGEEVRGSKVTAGIAEDGIRFKGRTRATPGHYFTIWAILFDDDGDDSTLDRLTAWGAGAVAQRDGTLRFEFLVPAGDVPPVNGATVRKRPADGSFDNPETATGLKLVFRDHGPAQPFMQGAQTGTHAGGCAGLPATDGPPGPFVCQDIQHATFPGS